MFKKTEAKKVSPKGTVPFFEDLFRGIWARVVAMLGVTNARSMFEHGLAEAVLRYPVLAGIRVQDGGVNLTKLNDVLRGGGDAARNLEEALWAYLEVFTRVLSELSGEMLSRQVVEVIEKRDKGKDFSSMLYRTGLNF